MTNVDRDPDFKNALQRQLNEAPSQEPEVIPSAAQVWAVCSKCPSCGFPIWFNAIAPADQRPPQVYTSCACTQIARLKAAEEWQAYIMSRRNGKEMIHP